MCTAQRYSAGVLFGAALLALTACGDSSAPPVEDSGVEFTYAGTVSGRFRAAGPASDALDPGRSFAAAFRSGAGELQLCAYEATGQGSGNFLLLNVGVIVEVGGYGVPPGWAPSATGYQPGTFLLGVDASRSTIAQISPFIQGRVDVAEVSDRRVRGTFTVTTPLATLAGGRFDVPFAAFADLPTICQ